MLREKETSLGDGGLLPSRQGKKEEENNLTMNSQAPAASNKVMNLQGDIDSRYNIVLNNLNSSQD